MFPEQLPELSKFKIHSSTLHRLAQARGSGSSQSLREFHLTPSTLFLSGWLPSRESPKSALQNLRAALSKQDVNTLLQQYASLLKIQRQRGPPAQSTSQQSNTLSVKDGQGLLRLLATCRKKLTGNDYRRLRRVFSELETWFGVKHPVQNHHWLLLGMVRANKADDALRWILAMPQTHGIQPGTQDWNVVLSGFNKPSRGRRKTVSPIEQFRDAWQHLLQSNVNPDAITFNIYLRALFGQEELNISDISAVLQDMQARSITPTTSTWSTLLEGYTARNHLEQATEAYNNLKLSIDLDTIAWNSILAYAGHFHGAASVWREWEEWQNLDDPPEPDDYTFAHFLRHGAKDVLNSPEPVQAALDELNSISERCAIHPSPWACAAFIQRLLSCSSDPEQGFRLALDFYHKVIFGPGAIMPHSVMVNPLLERLLEIGPSDQLSQAIRLFDSLSEGVEEGYAPDVGVCHSVLRICEQSGPPGVEYALSVLDHMRQEHLTFERIETALEHTDGLMKASGSYQLAFKAYSWMRALDPTQFDTEAYNKVLTTFSFLDFSSSASNPAAAKIAPQFFLEILKDMRSSGQSPDTITYTLLLEYYSRRYKRADQVRRLHDIIKVDLQYDPDIRLHNALIVAYGYVGDYNAAFRVWQSLMANRHRPNMGINHATISAILDVCGFSNSKAKADHIFQSIQNDRSLPLNKRNWDTWVECLGRLGCLEQACGVVEKDMADMADLDTADILFKFARRAGPTVHQQVRDKMQASRPDLLAADNMAHEETTVPGS